MLFKMCGSHNAAREDAIAKPGCEPLDLILDLFGHVYLRSVRHVTVSPESVFAERRTRWIEECRLRKNDVGFVCVLPELASFSEVRISAKEPAMCTVAAFAHSGDLHGTGALNAQSSLNAAVP